MAAADSNAAFEAFEEPNVPWTWALGAHDDLDPDHKRDIVAFLTIVRAQHEARKTLRRRKESAWRAMG
jgi:hypothetical protein